MLFDVQVRDETYTAFENIYPVLTEFRKIQQWYGRLLIPLPHYNLYESAIAFIG